jgi:hypothetical protein
VSLSYQASSKEAALCLRAFLSPPIRPFSMGVYKSIGAIRSEHCMVLGMASAGDAGVFLCEDCSFLWKS